MLTPALRATSLISAISAILDSPFFLPAYRLFNTEIYHTNTIQTEIRFLIYHNIAFQIMQEIMADFVNLFGKLLFFIC